ncbi:MAG: N-acetyl-gamma-glutamyl-phosphate reductase [Planctomycetota bacterium]
MSPGRIGVCILGAAGYGGQELLRLLAVHPHFTVAAAGSRRHDGRPVEEVLPQLRGFYPGLRFRTPEEALAGECSAVLLATPHGVSRELWPQVAARRPDARVIDLSGDFRLRDRALFDRFYGGEHAAFDAVEHFVYGLTETQRGALREARRVANPGCFAAGALLALAPLAERGLLHGEVAVASTTGSSGSGAEAKATTHHPERAQDHRAYNVLLHRHQPEIEQELRRLGAGDVEVAMVPQSGAFSRGIFTVAQLRLREDADAPALFAERYATEPFVRVRDSSPALRHVVRTNFCDVGVVQEGRRLVVLTALDNLVKGMSGQAVQNLNLLFGRPETEGLLHPGANP